MVSVNVVLSSWLDLMHALTLVGMLHIMILTMLFKALVPLPVLLTCVTTRRLVAPLNACIGEVLNVLRLLGPGSIVPRGLATLVLLTDSIREMACTFNARLRNRPVILFKVICDVALCVSECLSIGWVLLKLHPCTLARLVRFGWGWDSGVPWFLCGTLRLSGLVSTILAYPGYLAPVTLTVMGELTALLKCILASTWIPLRLNPTCVLWLHLRCWCVNVLMTLLAAMRTFVGSFLTTVISVLLRDLFVAR